MAGKGFIDPFRFNLHPHHYVQTASWPPGFVFVLDGQVDVPGLDALYDLYSFNVIPALGRAVAGDAEAYRYLVESIRRFPRPDAFAEMMRAAGFARASFQRMTGGIVALHSGWRL